MFNSTALKIAIGLTCVYLIISVIVTSANELIANWFRSRAQHLERGIRSPLLDPQGTMTRLIYDHPLIQGLTKFDENPAYRKPSYIPSATFAVAFLELAGVTIQALKANANNVQNSIAGLPEAPWKKALQSLASETQGDFQKLKTNVEVWFDNAMERVSGWYKRKTQWVTLWIGFGLTVLLNADSLKIGHAMANSPAVRSALAAEGEKIARQGNMTSPRDVENRYREVSSLGIPMGWAHGNDDFLDLETNRFSTTHTIEHVLGWVLTAVAASLGAPFWFDVLNKIINIRSSGRAPGDAPRSPRKIPPARTEGGAPA